MITEKDGEYIISEPIFNPNKIFVNNVNFSDAKEICNQFYDNIKNSKYEKMDVIFDLKKFLDRNKFVDYLQIRQESYGKITERTMVFYNITPVGDIPVIQIFYKCKTDKEVFYDRLYLKMGGEVKDGFDDNFGKLNTKDYKGYKIFDFNSEPDLETLMK